MPSLLSVVSSKTEGHCWYCYKPAGGVDHQIPVSRGGSDDYANLVPCCLECNSRKGAKTVEEFRDIEHVGNVNCPSDQAPYFTSAQRDYLKSIGIPEPPQDLLYLFAQEQDALLVAFAESGR